MFRLDWEKCELLVREIEDDFEEEGLVEEVMVDCDVCGDEARGIVRALELQEKTRVFNEQKELALCVR